MPSLHQVVASNNLFRPSYLPVALFIGGTSGIGEAMALRLANQTGGRSHIILLGRDGAKAKEILDRMPSHAEGKKEFVQVDLMDLSTLRTVLAEQKGKLEKINFLIMTAGFLSLDGYTPTIDGLDRKLSVHYFGRFRAAYELAHLVEKAGERGEEASIVTVLDGSGRGGRGKPFMDDLKLEKYYSIGNAAKTAVTYNDIAMTELAIRYPHISTFHINPGGVDTPITKNKDLPWIARTGVEVLRPVLKMLPMMTSMEDCAEYMWYNVWSGEERFKKGNWNVGSRGELAKANEFAENEETRRVVWDFSVQATNGK
ncbi:NAD(P)-binding protein [Atractiella rhizophila]|nr:NAD(P)-binding protein [Atractiella rhizophila]